jgi:short-subunit dehydrogenase
MTPAPTSIVVTGASSGIGEALALHYAQRGRTLGLTGRDRDRLDGVAARCRASGCDVHTATIDVRDRAALAQWLVEFDRLAPVDLAVANAGVSTGTPPGQLLEDADAADRVMEVNVLGVLNTIQPLLPLMIARGRGQIAIISSIAGLIPLADSPAYCGSKAGIRSYGLALRQRVHATGVCVNVVCPGYIATPMTDGIRGWKPLEMSLETATAHIVGGLARDRAVIAFPWPLVMAARFGAALPEWLSRVVTRPFRRVHASRPR